MAFNSTIFIFIFMPVVFTLIFLFNKTKLQNHILLFASLVFYAWGEPIYIFLLVGLVFINYILALCLLTNNTKRRRLLLLISLVINISALCIFKYTSFIIENLNKLLNINIHSPKILLPMGISFFTFHLISYIMDVYHKETMPQKSFSKLLFYISFFPQLISGPIVKYHDIYKQIDFRTICIEDISSGINRFIIGLSKKVLIANTLGKVVDSVFSMDTIYLTTPLVWFAAISYCIQLYFDFSGYSDMAIGLAKVAGFKFSENFNYPFISKNIKEFWRRWHISLSTWFRDYVYIPLGGSRKGIHCTALNTLIVFLLTGIWHGASWTFIIWGLFHGIIIVLENYKIINTDKWKLPIFKHIYTLLVVIIGFVFFRADDLEKTIAFMSNMFMSFNFDMSKVLELMDNKTIIALISGIVCSMPILNKLKEIKLLKALKMETAFTCSLVLYIFCLLFLSQSTYNPFIYFRF